MRYSLLALAFASYAAAQSGAWGQCGGIGWTGATTCVDGYYCSSLNPYYSQCLPGSGGTSVATATSSTTLPASTTSRTTTSSSTTSLRTTTTSRTTLSSTRTSSTTSRTTSRTTLSTSTTSRATTSTSTVSRTTTSSTTTPVVSTTSSGPAPSGTAIRGVTAPVYHKYLQNSNGVAILGPEASQAKFIISGGTIRISGADLYLNIDTSATTSYKALSFGATPNFSNWGLEGDTIITTQSSVFGRQLNYVVCGPVDNDSYVVYLQTGSQLPSGPGACTNYLTMHLPCLC
ncbi:hypothetical protein ABW19_dt0204285 [Dactylella cylindrospora]|nr:hypothetical protein ABW19_dt0204285 [Dactylella cylindrospora]